MNRDIRRRVVRAGALLATTALMMTGCAKADTNASGGDGGTLTLWTHAGGAPKEIALLKKVIADYNSSQKSTRLT